MLCMADRLEQLRNAKRELRTAIVESNKRAKSAREAAKRKDKALQKEWALGADQVQIMLTIYQLAECTADAVVPFLNSIAAERHWPAKQDAELHSFVEGAFLAADVNELLAWVDDVDVRNPLLYGLAYEHFIQWQVAAWTCCQNRKGVAPSTSEILDKLERLRNAAPLGVPLHTWGPIDNAGSRKRALRWRRRFGGGFKRIRPREDVPDATKLQKITAVWQWSNYYRSKLLLERKALLVFGVCLEQDD